MNKYQAAIELYKLPPECEYEMHFAKGDDPVLEEYFGHPLVQARILAGRLAVAHTRTDTTMVEADQPS